MLSLKRLNYFRFVIIVTMIFVSTPVFAAEVSFVSKNETISVDQQFQIDVVLNTQGDEVNAIEGIVVFPEELLELETVHDGNSMINFWIEKPHIASGNTIVFSGMTPGGYSGSNGSLFSLIFQTKDVGEGTIEISDITALKNDGEGTMVNTQGYGLPFKILESQTEAVEIVVEDANAPEPFALEVANDPSLFDGAYFLVFSTQDKETSISHYEVKEVRQKILAIFSPWQQTESPYELTDQELKSHIIVRAIDQSGNVTVAKLIPRNSLLWYENFRNWFILFTGFVLVFLLKTQLWRQRAKSK